MRKLDFAVCWLAMLLYLNGLCQAKAAAASIRALSASFIDVSNAVAVANLGDTVVIPPGTNAWNQTLNISGIQLVGAGTNATVLLDEEPNVGNAALIVLQATNGYLTRLSGLTIASDASSYESYHGKVIASGSLPAQWEIDNVFFDHLKGDNVFCYGAAVSVITHCTFTLQGIAITLWDSGYGDLSWATPSTYGTANVLYIEDCFFTNVVPSSSSSAAFDCLAGGRSVFRHNTVWNTFWANHGTESGQRYRGCRSFEIYNNTFVDTQGFVYAMQFRSGTGVVFSNTASGFGYLAGINNYRSTDSFPPFGGVTGLSPWDNNDGTLYLSGVHRGTNNSPVLVVTNAGWKSNQWTGYTVNDTNTGRFCLIVGNTSDTMTMEPPKDLSPITFSTGDHFTIYRSYPALDQVGVGSGDLLVGYGAPYGALYNSATQTNSWPHQVSEPLYAWANTLNSAPANIGSGYPNIQENRDFFNNIPKPGYTPLTYPHPLTVTVNSLVPPANTNGPLTPPLNLGVHP